MRGCFDGIMLETTSAPDMVKCRRLCLYYAMLCYAMLYFNYNCTLALPDTATFFGMAPQTSSICLSMRLLDLGGGWGDARSPPSRSLAELSEGNKALALSALSLRASNAIINQSPNRGSPDRHPGPGLWPTESFGGRSNAPLATP